MAETILRSSSQPMNEHTAKNPASALYAKQRDHADISGIVPQMLDGTHSSSLNDSVFEMTPERMSKEEATEWWKQTKPERYALTAACIQKIWQSSADHRALHLAASEGNNEPKSLEVLRALSQVLFDDAIEDWTKTVHTDPQHPHTPLLSRLEMMLRFSETHGIVKDNSITSYLKRGVVTSTNVIWATIGTVPKMAHIYGISLSKEDAIATIRGAYHKVIAPLSHMNISIAAPILEEIMGIYAPEFNPVFFSLSRKHVGYEFALNYEVLALIRNSRQKSILEVEPYGKTVWCPANASMAHDTTSVIADMFDWSVRMADRYLATIQDVVGEDQNHET